MQSICLIHKASFDIGTRGFVNRNDVGDDGLNVARAHTLVRASAHSAAQERLTISNRLRHLHVAILRGGTKSVRLTRFVFFVGIIREMGVIQCTQYAESLGVRTGTGINTRLSPRARNRSSYRRTSAHPRRQFR